MEVMPTRLLVLEDDDGIRNSLALSLEDEGYDVVQHADAESALATVEREPVDLMLVDLMLGGMDGFTFIRRARPSTDAPIIVLSARNDTHDIVSALEAGADDYVTKPYVVREVLARLKALLRRPAVAAETTDTPPADGTVVLDSTDGPLLLSPDAGTVRRGDDAVHLTVTEFRLLCELADPPGRVLSRTTPARAGVGPRVLRRRAHRRRPHPAPAHQDRARSRAAAARGDRARPGLPARRPMRSRWGLRASVTVSFAAGALLLSVVLAAGAYFVVRHYLVEQRERTATRQAFADASFVRDGLLTSGAQVSDVLGNAAPPADTDILVHRYGRWFSSSLQTDAHNVPDTVRDGRARRCRHGALGPQRSRTHDRRRCAAAGGRRGGLRDLAAERAEQHVVDARRRARWVRARDDARGCAARPRGRPPGGGTARRRRARGDADLRRRPHDAPATHRRPRPGRHRGFLQRHGRGPRRAHRPRRALRRRHQPRAEVTAHDPRDERRPAAAQARRATATLAPGTRPHRHRARAVPALARGPARARTPRRRRRAALAHARSTCASSCGTRSSPDTATSPCSCPTRRSSSGSTSSS